MMGLFGRKLKLFANETRLTPPNGIITLKDGDKVICTIPYNEHWRSRCPPAPQKPGYNAHWSELDLGSLEMHAVYDAIDYTITYYVEGEVYKIEHFTIDKPMYYPPTPKKDGYLIMWPRFNLEPKDNRMDAIVRPISSTARIFLDGIYVKSVPFSVKNPI